MDPRGTVGRIYNEDHYTLLHTKDGSSGPLTWFQRRRFFYVCSIVSLWELMTPGGAISDPKGHAWQDLCKVPHNNAAY